MDFGKTRGELLLLVTALQSFLGALSVSGTPTTNPSLTDATFARCPRGAAHSGQVLTTINGRSPLDCMSRCSEWTGCEAINVCPDGVSSRRAVCTLLDSGGHVGCDQLTNASSPSCFFARKVSVELGLTDG